MKKLALMLLLSAGFSAVAQTETSTEEKKAEPKFDFYFGIGGLAQSKYNLNDKLSSASLPELNLTAAEFTLGWNVFGEKFSGGYELGFIGTEDRVGNGRSRLIGLNNRLVAHYNFVNKEKIAFTGGLNIGYTTNQVDIYYNNTVVDLDDLAGKTNVLTLRNGMLFAGPSVGVYLFKNKKYATRVNLAY